MISDAHHAALALLQARLFGRSVDWAITGSTGMALQGMPLQPRDLDLQANEIGAYEIADALSEFVTEPVDLRESERVRSHFGRLRIGDLDVEVMGDMQHRAADGSWAAPVCLPCYKRWVKFEADWLPVLSIAYEASAYEQMGRAARAAGLRAWADTHPEARVEEITNFRLPEPWLGTGGQPLPTQYPALAGAGYRALVNLVPADVPNALPGEDALCAAAGLEYIPIPVYWEQPTQENLDAFFAALDARRGQPVFAHCTLNYRVATFVYLYRTLRLGVPEAQARADLLAVWTPNATWERLITSNLPSGTRPIPG